MKRRFLTTAARFGLSTILSVCSATAHCGEDAFAKWATAHALPVTTVDAAGDDSDLLPLKSVIGNARVVALGEPIHGAHEPLAFRNRLFRFLVEQMGFTAIALEYGFTESSAVDSFIDGGEGDAGNVARDPINRRLHIENRELIQWMRDYNATASSAGHRRLRFYGIDITAGGRPSGPRRTIDSALTYLSRADLTTAQKIRDSLSDSLPGADDRGAFRSLPATAQAQFETSIQAIARAMQKSRKSLIARSSDDEFRWALHNLDAARQLAKCLPLTPPNSTDKNGWAVTMTCRDSAMAENVQWVLRNEGRQGRLLVFAHNSHVMNWKEEGRRWATARERPTMMGLHLRRMYGKNLYIIAISCATTSGTLLGAKPMEEDSIDSTLAGVGLPLMFLDTRMARQNKEALAWLTTQRSFNSHLQTQSLITPAAAVDAFFFVKTLTPAIRDSDKAPD
jgi:erythromycin esterase